MTVLMKTRQQIEHLRAAGRIVAETYETLRPHVVPGVSTAELDDIAERYIRSQGALPVYKGFGGMRDRKGKLVRPPFPATICVAVNNVICHGIPSPREVLAEGDIIGIDIGATYHGWVGDSCVTFAVGTVDAQTRELLDVAHRAMEVGIEQALPGRRFGEIGAAIQRYAESEGFSVVREYGGHGVGRSLHEDPFVSHAGDGQQGPRITPGMVFTIEPMINEGMPETRLGPDHWAVFTADGSRSAQFEHTLGMTEDGHEILTLP